MSLYKIIETLSVSDFPGKDGKEIKIKLQKRDDELDEDFIKGCIITYDKFNGPELYIKNIEDDVFTCVLINDPNHKYVDNKFLAKGIMYFNIGSHPNDYSKTSEV